MDVPMFHATHDVTGQHGVGGAHICAEKSIGVIFDATPGTVTLLAPRQRADRLANTPPRSGGERAGVRVGPDGDRPPPPSSASKASWAGRSPTSTV